MVHKKVRCDEKRYLR